MLQSKVVQKVPCGGRTFGSGSITGNRSREHTHFCRWEDSFRIEEAVTTIFLLVVPTLIKPDVILGMGLLQRLGVKIDTKAGVAEPTVLVSHIQPPETWRVPAWKSVVFQVKNPFPGKNRNVLFELSNKLPAAIRGTASLGQGEKVYVWLENTGEDELILNPDWEIGTVEVVEEEPDYPQVEAEKMGLPPVPEELTDIKKKKKK